MFSAKFKFAISENDIASRAEADAAVATGPATHAPIIPRPAAVALVRNRRRSAGFSALRSIRSCTYLFPNIVFLLGLVRSHRDTGWTARPAFTSPNLLGETVPAAGSLGTGPAMTSPGKALA